MLPLSLALLAVPIGVPAPPECPWEFGGSAESLIPSGTIPRNASFWIRDYRIEPVIYAVIDQTNGSTISIDQIDIELTSTGGRLVELRPRLPLAPLRAYELDLGSFPHAFVTTSSVVDLDPPAPPQVTGAFPITSPYDVCQTAGITVSIMSSAEPVIYLIEDPTDGSLYELGVDPSFGYLRPNLAVVTEPNETIPLRVVAIDFAGNRSDASAALNGTAGEVPQVQGKIDPTIDPRTGLPRDRPGCNCSQKKGRVSILEWLALGCAFTGWRARRVLGLRRSRPGAAG